MRRVDTPDGRMYEHGGKLYPSVTSVLGLMESPFLQRDWPVRVTAKAAIANPDANVEDLVALALEEMDRKAGYGTAVHEFMECTLQGAAWDDKAHVIQVRNLVKSVRSWLAVHTVEPLACEAGVVNVTHGYAGTADLYATVDGHRLCVDYKTGQDVWGEAQLQLTAYQRAEFIPLDDDPCIETVEPVPDTDGIAVLHIRPKSCELIHLVSGDSQWRSFLYMLEAWRITQRYHRRLTAQRGE